MAKIIVRNPKFYNGQWYNYTSECIEIYHDKVISVTDKDIGKILYEIIDKGYDYDYILKLELI